MVTSSRTEDAEGVGNPAEMNASQHAVVVERDFGHASIAKRPCGGDHLAAGVEIREARAKDAAEGARAVQASHGVEDVGANPLNALLVETRFDDAGGFGEGA